MLLWFCFPSHTQIYLPIWGPQTTTESRLVCDYRPIVNYNNVKYEQQMFSFNTVARTKLYEHGVAALGLIRLHVSFRHCSIVSRFSDSHSSAHFCIGLMTPL